MSSITGDPIVNDISGSEAQSNGNNNVTSPPSNPASNGDGSLQSSSDLTSSDIVGPSASSSASSNSTGVNLPRAAAAAPQPSNNVNNANNVRPLLQPQPLGPSFRFGFGVPGVIHQQHQLPPSGGIGRPPNPPTAGINLGGGVGAGGGPTTGAVPQPTNNNNGELPQQTQNLFQMRDRLFLALFFRISLIYARAFPKTLRRALEFCLLMQSIMLLFILGYIHIVYTRTPITCLGEFKDSWPKNGVLRVEITSDGGDKKYDLAKSYAKEERLRQRAASQFGHYTDDILSYMLTADS
jgi:hypothetical protein